MSDKKKSAVAAVQAAQQREIERQAEITGEMRRQLAEHLMRANAAAVGDAG